MVYLVGGGDFGSWSLASRFSSLAIRPFCCKAWRASNRSSFGLKAGPGSRRVCDSSALSIAARARFSPWESTAGLIASS